jgi:molybdopterin-guanine dinucleotide biosynthesis protein A
MAPAQISYVNIALLAGGESSRMGSPKFLLAHSDGTPVYLNRLRMLREAFPEAQRICLVLRDRFQEQHISIPADVDVQVLLVAATTGQARLSGPAAGLHAAYCFDPTSHWLVVPCDYPLLGSEELRGLYERYQHPITCFENSQGSAEPLVAIWSPEALANLAAEDIGDRAGLSDLVSQLRGLKISPQYDHSLFNTNTKEEWDDALLLLKHMHNASATDASQD